MFGRAELVLTDAVNGLSAVYPFDVELPPEEDDELLDELRDGLLELDEVREELELDELELEDVDEPPEFQLESEVLPPP